MSPILLEPYLLLSGTEIANSIRTLSYLRQGLGGGEWSASICPTVAEGSGYESEYHDVYVGDRYEVANLCCFCETQHVDGNYGDPPYDMAPWYDPGRPESADFLGLIPEITLLPVADRNVTRRSAGRGDVGPLIVGPRIIQVKGAIYAGSKAGMGYGERWLSKVLTGTCGPGCSGDTLTVLPYCTAHNGDDGTGSLRELVPVGIVDGPTFSAPIVRAVCQYQEVSFQLAAGEGWLRKTTQLYSGALTHCETLTPSLIGDAASVISITAGSDLDGVVISAGSISYTVVGLLAGQTLTIDASKHTVQVTAGGVVVGGMNTLDFTGMFRFISACAGDDLEVCVDASAATGSGSLTIDQVLLEL